MTTKIEIHYPDNKIEYKSVTNTETNIPNLGLRIIDSPEVSSIFLLPALRKLACTGENVNIGANGQEGLAIILDRSQISYTTENQLRVVIKHSID